MVLAYLFSLTSCKQSVSNQETSSTKIQVESEKTSPINTTKLDENFGNKNQVSSKISVSDNDKLKSIKKDLDITEIEGLRKIHFKGTNPTLNIYTFTEGYSFLNTSDNYYPLEFNYTYNTTFEDAIEGISLFKGTKDESVFIVLPSYTEEFSTYHILNISKEKIKDFDLHTFSMNEYNNFKKSLTSNKFELFKKDDKILLSCCGGDTKVDFDVVIKNEKVNSKPIDENDKNSISKL